MSTPIPPPLRAAAGLAALAIDSARKVPQQLVGLPVLAVSTALQASLKAQQAYAGLVARGDEVLNQFRGHPDTPLWARFDDDEPAGGQPPAGFGTAADTASDAVLTAALDAAKDAGGTDVLVTEVVVEEADRTLDPDVEPDVLTADDAAAVDTEFMAAPDLAEVDAANLDAAEAVRPDAAGLDGVAAAEADLAGGTGDYADPAGPESAARDVLNPNGRPPGSVTEPGTDLPEDGARLAAGAAAAEAALAADGPLDGYLAVDPPLPGYDDLSIPQLRGRLRSLTVGQIEELIAYERANQGRPPYLTMLENRLASLRSR